MDVLVQPALKEAMWAEAMCLAILEALDRGIPVIAARDGGNPEVVRDGFNGLLVSIEDKTDLGRALALFVGDRKVREQLQAGARNRLDRRFSMETFNSGIRTTIGQLCPLENTGELGLGPTAD
jgi:glycosyltransferase involved in cell wall biosynthesis